MHINREGPPCGPLHIHGGIIIPWLCVDHMIQQGVWPMVFSYPDPLANPDPLCNIQKLRSCFHQYFIYIHKFNKTMA